MNPSVIIPKAEDEDSSVASLRALMIQLSQTSERSNEERFAKFKKETDARFEALEQKINAISNNTFNLKPIDIVKLEDEEMDIDTEYVSEHFASKRVVRDPYKALQTDDDFIEAILDCQLAKSMLTSATDTVSAEQREFQSNFCCQEEIEFTISSDELHKPFVLSDSIKKVKDQGKILENLSALEFAKLTKEITSFYQFPPQEAIYNVFQTLVNLSKVSGENIFSFLHILAVSMISANGGIDIYNPRHLHTIKWAMKSFDQKMSVEHFFSILTTLSSTLTKFFQDGLCWRRCTKVSICSSFKELNLTLLNMPHVRQDPSLQILLLERKTGDHLRYTEIVDETARALQTTIFSKYPICDSIKSDEKSCKYGKFSNLFQAAINDVKTAVQHDTSIKLAVPLRKFAIAQNMALKQPFMML